MSPLRILHLEVDRHDAELVEATLAGGTMGVTTVSDQGSTFWIEFPLSVAVHPRGDASGDRGATPAEVPKASGVVLYVEDNRSNVRLLQRVLERRPGVRLLHAPNGRDGLRMARDAAPDLILLDLHLPDMSGEDVLRQLSEDPVLQHIPVAILSADALPAQSRRLRASGAVAYLTKPLDIGQVIRTIDESLSDARARAGDRR